MFAPKRSGQLSLSPLQGQWIEYQLRLGVLTGNVASIRWQVKLCGRIWHVSSHSVETTGDHSLPTSVIVLNTLVSGLEVPVAKLVPILAGELIQKTGWRYNMVAITRDIADCQFSQTAKISMPKPLVVCSMSGHRDELSTLYNHKLRLMELLLPAAISDFSCY